MDEKYFEEMEARIPEDDHYVYNSLQIKEPDPDHSTLLEKEKIDVIIVPLLAFDEKRKRLGYGGGYYDRYLKDFKGLKIGVGFEAQKNTDLPEEEHDIPLDIIITEKSAY